MVSASLRVDHLKMRLACSRLQDIYLHVSPKKMTLFECITIGRFFSVPWLLVRLGIKLIIYFIGKHRLRPRIATSGTITVYKSVHSLEMHFYFDLLHEWKGQTHAQPCAMKLCTGECCKNSPLSLLAHLLRISSDFCCFFGFWGVSRWVFLSFIYFIF